VSGHHTCAGCNEDDVEVTVIHPYPVQGVLGRLPVILIQLLPLSALLKILPVVGGGCAAPLSRKKDYLSEPPLLRTADYPSRSSNR
jgi:hypothetical protein